MQALFNTTTKWRRNLESDREVYHSSKFEDREGSRPSSAYDGRAHHKTTNLHLRTVVNRTHRKHDN